ncbi:choice-of-anchor Q domain-containing protein [Pontiellaceae bacterium B12227]|nr:choice-of-anchor Q domain-containing protein [Pontiellaceae bacterium B12227]
MKYLHLFTALLLFLATFNASALEFYVSTSGSDGYDGYGWGTAKATIQAAIDTATAGDTINVGAGIYSIPEEIRVDKALLIKGEGNPADTVVLSDGNSRCFNLYTNTCILSGFTITNGYANSGAGIYCEDSVPVVTNCVIGGNSEGGGMYKGRAFDCEFIGNTSDGHGGGIYLGIANGCLFSGNMAAGVGGGMYQSAATNCVFIGNRTTLYGGAAYYSSAYQCTFKANHAKEGGGVYNGTAERCTFEDNSADSNGGGMYKGTANNCVFTRNTAEQSGGAMYTVTANNCTITENECYYAGGGMYMGTANNCIFWKNERHRYGATSDMYYGSANNCCILQAPYGSKNCITNDPMLVSASHISTNSPCVGAGSTNYVSGTDIDGNAWASTPSMGCIEPVGTTAGEIDLAIKIPQLILVDHPTEYRIRVEGEVSETRIDFGDGTVITNSIIESHEWVGAGVYDVVLTAFNSDYPLGLSITQQVSVTTDAGTAIHVAVDGNDDNDGLSWTSPKATIQAGVDAQGIPGGMVWLYNGTYQVTQEIKLERDVVVQSVNGRDVTVVDGGGSSRCFYLTTTNCAISGLTINNGYASGARDGGGVCCILDAITLVSDCLFIGNSAIERGGGMIYGIANDCIFHDNFTVDGNGDSHDGTGAGKSYGVANDCLFYNNVTGAGGGMADGVANNCVFSNNSATATWNGGGGGMKSGTATHCTFIGNHSANEAGGMYSGTANHCSFIANTAVDGGGAYYCDAFDCLFDGNTAEESGGGLWGTYSGGASSVKGCTFINNSATVYGGGMCYGNAYSCAFVGNAVANNDSQVETYGGGMQSGYAHSCTFTGNSAMYGGGMQNVSANNCIAWYNAAAYGSDLYDMQAVTYTCSPDVEHGVDGNITNAPMLASFSHLSAGSPCVAAGNAAQETDIDGESWAAPPSMGCDEPGATTGAVELEFIEMPTQVVAGYDAPFAVRLSGAVSSFKLDFGDGQTVWNTLAATHAWNSIGSSTVQLTAYSDNYPGGISEQRTVEVLTADDAAIYVKTDGNDGNDGRSWSTPKASIVAGVAAQTAVGGTVWVASGTHWAPTEIVVDKEINVRAFYGPGATAVLGNDTNRIFNLSGNCLLEGFTITNGYTEAVGGGVFCEWTVPVVSNCVFLGNNAEDGGGGMFFGTSVDCEFIDNHADRWGGGMYWGIAIDCTFSGNDSGNGGGKYDGIANGCTFVENKAGGGAGMSYGEANSCSFESNVAESGGGMSGGTANRCTFTGNASTLSWSGGGGMSGGTANHCLFVGNVSTNDGGGMDGGTANNCIFTGNSAKYGGGQRDAYAYNCTFSGNSASVRGGGVTVGYGRLYNTIVCGNIAPTDSDIYGSHIYYTCSPDAEHGSNGNTTNAPLFVSATDLHLQVGSPCADAGAERYMPSDADIDGIPRPLDGDADGVAVVDMGAYELLNPAGDSDGDGQTDGGEQMAGTDMLDASSFFALTGMGAGFPPVLEFESLADRNYTLLMSTNLVDGAWEPISAPRAGAGGSDSLQASTATEGEAFYRVEISLP